MRNKEGQSSIGGAAPAAEKKSVYMRFAGWADGSTWRVLGVSFVLSALVLLIFSVYNTPLNNYYGYDSAFFQLIGKGIANGKIPYIDLYDQKGPMVFYINALGYLLTGSRLGVFLLQILFMTASLCVVYRLARLWLNSSVSFGILFAYLFLYIGTVQEGNMTEEWSQIFLLLPLYLSLRFLKSSAAVSEHPKRYSFLYGVCFGALLMFRVTNAASVGGLILAFIILFCREKKARQLLVHALLVLLGAAVVIAPFCLYFVRVNAFDEFIHASITHNFSYATGGVSARGLRGWVSILGSVFFAVPFCAAYRPLTESGTLDTRTYILLAGYTLVGAVSMFFGYTYRHYFLNLVPAVTAVLLIGIAWGIRTAPEHRGKARRAIAAALLVCLLPFVPQAARQCGKVVLYTGLHQLDRDVQRGEALSAAITSDRDSVWGYNVEAQAYLYADLLPCFRFFALQEWMEASDARIAPEIGDRLANDPPVWVFLGREEEGMIEKLLSLGYEEVECSSYCLLHKAL